MLTLSRHSAVALSLGMIGLAFAYVVPFPAMLVGLVVYLAAIVAEPWVAVPLIVLTLPFSAQPRLIGSLELTTAEIATLLASVIVGAGAIMRARGARAESGHDDHGAPWSEGGVWLAAAFLAAGLLSLLVTEYPKQSLRELRWVVVEPICLFFIARATLTSPPRVAVALWTLVGAGVLAAVTSLADAAIMGQLTRLAERVAYPYPSPNHLGLFLGRTAAVALTLACFGPGIAWSRIALIPIGLALLRTLSLGAWVGVAGAALAVTALRGRRWIAGTALVLIIGCVALAVALPRERTVARFDPGQGTGLFRLQIWQSSLHMIADHPLLGIGLDNFLYQYRGQYMLPEAWEEPNISHPHNWVLHFWLALGLPGLAAAIGAIIWMVARARALVTRPLGPVDRAVGAAAVGILVDTLLHGSFDNSYFLLDAAMVWWLTIALLAGASSPRAAAKVDPVQSRTMGTELPL